MLILSMVVGCTSNVDYVLHAEGDGEIVYIEVEGETVEVPVYIVVEVPGETEYGEIWVDSFTQPQSVDGVDILWIIDTSGSMGRYDPQLTAGLEAMLNALPTAGWRLAIMSNDPNRAAAESQFPLVPGDDIGDAMSMYASMGRGHHEKGFDAAYEYIVNNSYASTWLRPDAALLVVFVSDEEEQSDSYFSQVNDFKYWYGSQRGGSAYVASIVNVEQADSVCTHSVSSIDIGDRYMEATNYFSGVIVDICSEDWSTGVQDASSRLEPYEFLKLTHTPSDINSIRVFVNGSLNWDWFYEPSDNTVYFTVIPAGNDRVEIGYHYDPATGQDTGDTGA